MSPNAPVPATSNDNEPTTKHLDRDQSRVFRELLKQALVDDPNNALLISVKNQAGASGESHIELSSKEFIALVKLLEQEVNNLAAQNDRTIANGFLDDWDPCRDGGTKIIVTQ